MQSSTVSSAELSGWPGPTTRLVVSFLLFLHLFALFVAVSSRATAKGGAVATVETQLRNVPGVQAYAQLLRMDLSYTFWLTYGPGADDAIDMHHWFEADLTMPDGSKQQVVLPESSLRPGQRYGRYEALARTAGGLLPNDSYSSLIPFDVAARLVAETGAISGRIRLRQQFLPEEPFIIGAQQANTPFEATFSAMPDGLLFNKVETPTDSSPPPRSPTPDP